MASNRIKKLFWTARSGVLRPFYRTHRIHFSDSEIVFPLADAYVYSWFVRYAFRKFNWHEPSITQFVLDLPKDKSVLIDVGAHLGYFSAVFSRRSGNRSFALELDPVNFAHLERMVASVQGVQGDIEALNLGISDSECLAEMPVTAASPMSSLQRASSATDETRPVRVTTLDIFCRERGIVPDIVKVDVEGHEWEFLQGAGEVLRHYRPILVIEVHVPQLADKGVSVDDLVSCLKGYGYSIYWFPKLRSKTPGSLAPFEGAGEKRNFDIICQPDPDA